LKFLDAFEFGFSPLGFKKWNLIRMNPIFPARSAKFAHMLTGVCQPGPIGVSYPFRTVRLPDDDGNGIRQTGVPPLTSGLKFDQKSIALHDLCLPEEFRLPSDLFVLPIEFGKDTNLCPKNRRIQRLEEVIHGSQFIAVSDVLIVLVDGRNENDRGLSCSRPLTDQ